MTETCRPHQSTRYRNHEADKKTKPLPELYEARENCCGCTACFAVCPVGAIEMEPDDEGFLYPTVDAERGASGVIAVSLCAPSRRIKGRRAFSQKNRG